MPPLASPRLDGSASDSAGPSGPYRRWKVAGLVVLCAAWIVLGLVGHDPWKTEDATSFGIAWGMMQSGDWLVPTLAGEPYVDRPPLAYMAAALFGHLLSPVLPPHDAARIAAGAMLALTLALLAATAVELYGRGLRWVPVLLFVGTVGLWDRAHQLSPEMGLLAGIALALYGFALALRRPLAGGVALGLGAAMAFLARGFMGPLWLVVTALVLPLVLPVWRTRQFAATLAVALGVALPLAASWPLLLAARAPAHLEAWWAAQSIGDYFAPLAATTSGDPLYIVKNLPWLAWPALPLVLWTLWTRGRGFHGGLATPGIVLPGVLAVVIILCVMVMAEPRAIYAMPLMLPLCLLGALEVDSLQRGFSGALDWFGILTFGLLAAVVWWVWGNAVIFGIPPADRAGLPRHRARIPAARAMAGGRGLGIPDGVLVRAGPAGAPDQPPRGAQLGGRDDAGVGAVHVDLAALSGFAAQLPLGRRGAGARAAARRLRGEPEPRRAAARAAPLLRGHRDRAGGAQSRITNARWCWSSTAGTTACRRRASAGTSRGRAPGAATTPSASCCFGGSQREIHRRSMDRGDRR